MALREAAKKKKSSGGSKLRSSVKSRPKGQSTPAQQQEQAAQDAQHVPQVFQPNPIVPEPFEYVRFISQIPNLRKPGGG